MAYSQILSAFNIPSTSYNKSNFISKEDLEEYKNYDEK